MIRITNYRGTVVAEGLSLKITRNECGLIVICAEEIGIITSASDLLTAFNQFWNQLSIYLQQADQQAAIFSVSPTPLPLVVLPYRPDPQDSETSG